MGMLCEVFGEVWGGVWRCCGRCFGRRWAVFWGQFSGNFPETNPENKYTFPEHLQKTAGTATSSHSLTGPVETAALFVQNE